MQLDSNRYTMIFALIVCVVCSFSLAAVSEGLKARKELNVALDIKKNILKAVDLREPLDPKATPEKVLSTYQKKINELVIDKEGNVVEGKKPTEIKEGEEQYILYIYKEGDEPIAYCFPMVGKGLWGPLYAYLALEPDAVTVRGVTYYITPDFKETPGLGAEVTTDWFQGNFKGKKIWDLQEQELQPIAVVKGKVKDKVKDEKEAQYYVDGISGATMTSKGVTEMIERTLKIYEPFFNKIRDDK